MILAKASSLPFLFLAFCLIKCEDIRIHQPMDVTPCGGCILVANDLDKIYGQKDPAVEQVAENLVVYCADITPKDKAGQFCKAIAGHEFNFAEAYVSVRPNNPGARACKKIGMCTKEA
ncbi:hypothetical protein Ddc_17877 [Ditylenchus destructor]|nr:hypothetical protein Ddc_17877 [Ditylenchus destructor]